MLRTFLNVNDGKTLTACQAIREEVARGTKSITIVAPTATDLREVMIMGQSGLLAIYPPNDPNRPHYVPSKSRVEWPNGAVARLISAEESDRARGTNSGFAVFDELSSYKDPDIFHQVMFGLRVKPAKAIVTTTPKATPLMIELSKRFGDDIHVINGSTYENEANLSKNFIKGIKATYEGTSLGRQEIHGTLVLSSEDALWNPELIAQNTVPEEQLPVMVKYALGIDPAVTKGKHSDKTGIVLVGLGEDDKLYVLKDISGKYSPQQWSDKVIKLYDECAQYAPTTIVIETNMGGDLVVNTLSRTRAFLPIKTVFHSTNKMSRAEPVALLYEQGKVKHLANAGLQDLEDEMISFDGKNKKSPDMMDAMVMAATFLMPSKRSFVTSREFLI